MTNLFAVFHFISTSHTFCFSHIIIFQSYMLTNLGFVLVFPILVFFSAGRVFQIRYCCNNIIKGGVCCSYNIGLGMWFAEGSSCRDIAGLYTGFVLLSLFCTYYVLLHVISLCSYCTILMLRYLDSNKYCQSVHKRVFFYNR